MQRNRGSFFDHDIFRVEVADCEETTTVTDPDILAQEIVKDFEAALEQFREIAVDLGGEVVEPEKS
jgi:type I restriction enzyme M protein